ncbi:DUF333 domain-containing protein [Xenorhabdus griffiniae]|uniref:DUF333 domain-containing protein n=1 Tax=Xenorhabdus griffiniae TaxID=351672 RepID=A0ABY9XMR1_9GAMM|nr:DUF333 domain-containing protein [Xenorhabdus griffiniae]MBD1227456.1 DUF333 domain-containing protein [Xenorhabdus griffiniae]MBE8586106.1 DUF333 domain-containing protein [Xenorhabdus griffiniae]WMV74210.1 DUF333 domain-containing protein [Xenorhabdus griffiniae]WNH03890.1 DUF333 domain-containing protein [Xenorhabdus griffiniae]
MRLKRGVILVELLLVGAILAGCSGHQASRYKHYQPSDLGIYLSTDASESCSDAGGIPALTKQLDGHQVPVCQLANGRRCNEQALLDGGCTSF